MSSKSHDPETSTTRILKILSGKDQSHKSPETREKEKRKVLYLGTIANTFFFLGSACFMGFTVLEFNGRDRGTKANATYTSAFVCILLNGVIELCIDSCLQRMVHHARYSGKKRWNIVISVLFVLGTILDLAAFFLWNEREFTQEHRVQYASSHAWLLASILILCVSRPSDTTFQAILDGFSNILFFVGAILDCVVRYLDDPESGRAQLEVGRLEMSSAAIFLAVSVGYLVADCVTLRSLKAALNRNDDASA